MTPPIKIDGNPPTPLFPNGVEALEMEKIEEGIDSFQSDFLSQISGYQIGRTQAANFASRLFGNGNFRACTRFNQTVLSDAVNIPYLGTKADISVDQGARVCADFQTEEGVLRWPELIAMEGFSLWGIRPDRVSLNDDGHLKVETGCCLSYDVTAQVMKGPVGPLFPDNKITDLPLERFFLFEFPIPARAIGKGRLSQGVKALDLVGLWGEICPDALCTGSTAGVALYFDAPIFKQTMDTGLYHSFDFSGIREDSFIDWPDFPLGLLPLPPGLEIPEGSADLTWKYNPDTKTTTIGIKNLDAKLLVPAYFGAEPLHFSGAMTLTLMAGGDIGVHFERLKLDLPSLPSGKFDLLFLSSVFTGRLSLHWDPQKGKIEFREAHLAMEEIDLRTDPGRGLRLGKEGPAWGLQLTGNAGIDYVPSHPSQPLLTRWDLGGSMPIEAGGRGYELRDLRFAGTGSWQKIGARFVPNLNDFETSLSADLFRSEGGQDRLMVKGLGFKVEGKGSSARDGSTTQKASLTAGAESLELGGLQLVPSLKLELENTEKDGSFRMEGDGSWALTAATPGIRIGSDLHISTTDLRNFEWNAAFVEEQILGPILAKGKMSVDGNIGFSGAGSWLKNFKIVTEQSYSLSSNGKRIQKGIRISGKGRDGDSRISLRVPKVAGLGQVSIHLFDLPWRDRLVGNYQVSVLPQRVNRDLTLQDIFIKGKFVSPVFSEFFDKKKVFLSGSAEASLEGSLSGPIAADYRAVLRWAPDLSALVLKFRSDLPSTLSLGPIQVKDETTVIEGDARLQGSLIAGFKGGITLSGDDLGIKQGRVFVGLNGPIPVDDQGRKIPAVFDLSFVADRLSRIRNGVAFCGGRRCRLEAKVDLIPLKIAIDPNQSKLSIFKSPHRIQISPAAWWAAFRRFILTNQ